MAFVSQQPVQHDIRPILISRHSCSLPSTHHSSRPSNILSRRCRSASPPVKKRINATKSPARVLNILSSCGRVGECYNRDECREESLSVSPLQQPIIKSHTSSYLVKHPKLLRLDAVNIKSRTQVLSNHKNSLSISSVLDKIGSNQHTSSTELGSILSPSDVNGNHLRSLTWKKEHGKPRKGKITHGKSLSQPVTLSFEIFDENLNSEEKVEPAKKRKSSHNDVLAVSSGLFDLLPLECKLMIFSYLSLQEKGQCMFVSREWYQIVRMPEMWSSVDFTEFKLCNGHTRKEELKENSSHLERANFSEASNDSDWSTDSPIGFVQCTRSCYGRYISKIDNFISFLIDVKPKVRYVRFAFDLISDNWLATVSRFIVHVDLYSLKHAYINWRDTPVKPQWLDQPEPALNDLLYKTRRRQRKFLNFFETFVQEAPNVESLVLPFDWSNRSISYLTSLKKLKNLTLEKYFVLQRLSQDALNVLSGMKSLERLVLEIWNPSSADMYSYAVKSKTLKYLDVSQCRGFYLSSVDLPSLEVFITERRPWNGPLTFVSQLDSMNFICLQELLLPYSGRLKRFNNRSIESEADWTSAEMEELMSRVCPCKLHRSGITL